MRRFNLFTLKSREIVVQEHSESISGPTEIHDATNAQNPRGIRNTLRKLLSKFAISHREKAAAKPVPDSNQIETHLNQLDDESLWRLSPFTMKKRAETREVSPMVLPAARFSGLGST
ncbi:hypothetical protein AAP_05264 [Ascosphaera apis ARSEF 7405]|uniref:Uncharacterized protein n=1 Tax=Ascosphaera apis ARSEF 7405 TaxID=392613 RepID=A0A167VTS4_9EURO|nr:hypothetical protein AAP_05264 [Ascosphaera apis ARSEF 7405]